MGLFDFLKPKQKPEDETYTPIIPPDQEVYLIDLDDTVKPEEIYRPDTPRPEPVDVPHISLTYEEAIAQGWHFKRKSRRRIRITRYTGTEKNVIIPSEIDGHMVNELGKKAFMQTEIDSVMLPVTLRKIADGCFIKSQLKRAVFEDGIQKVPDMMFRNCRKLKSVRLPENISSIGNCAFSGCCQLKYISIPNTHFMLDIGNDAFYDSGLEGFALRQAANSWLNGNSFQVTPLQRSCKLLLSPEYQKKDEYKVLLVSRNADVKFPKGSAVWLMEGSVAAGCKLDLSGCAHISVDDKAIAYEYYLNGVTKLSTPCSVILPQGYTGLWFPETTKVSYADGTKYDGYLRMENSDEDTAILTLYSHLLHSFSVKCSERKIILRTTKAWMKFERYAFHTRELEHLVLEHIHGGDGELFSYRCDALHCVEWNEKTVYIPPAELIGDSVHDELLKAFCGRNINGILSIFDESVPNCIFTNEKKGTRLSQKQRILLAVDVLRSTESLFSDRTPYIRYLQTHKRYAMLLCRDLPEEYAGFLRSFYAVRT